VTGAEVAASIHVVATKIKTLMSILLAKPDREYIHRNRVQTTSETGAARCAGQGIGRNPPSDADAFLV
jgi:hypothetical protein